MGTPCCRVGDTGVGSCSAHPPLPPVPYMTTIIMGATTVLNGGLGRANMASIGLATCGHLTIVITASATVRIEGTGAHRVGDTGHTPGGPCTMITGSPNILTG